MIANAFIVPDCVEYDYLPIVHFDKQPIIEGRLNGQKAYFMLDSGSQLSLLNSSAAEAFSFGVSRKGPDDRNLNGVGGAGEKLKYAYEYQLGLGMQATIDVSFFAYGLDHLLDEKNGIRPIGIIGGDLMKRYGFQIDFKNKCVRIRNFKLKE